MDIARFISIGMNGPSNQIRLIAKLDNGRNSVFGWVKHFQLEPMKYLERLRRRAIDDRRNRDNVKRPIVQKWTQWQEVPGETNENDKSDRRNAAASQR
jgi:hypothetical protein